MGGGSAGEGWGNGKAAAVAYAREGAKVMVVDLNAEAAEQTSQIILSENEISSYTTANVTNSVDVQKVVSDTIKEFGQIDILHNNVGLPQMGSVTDISEENWQKAMDVNLKSVYLAMKYVIPHMKERKKGAIVNISSLAGIRVNAIMPGLINTPLIYNSISGQYDNVEEMVAARDASCSYWSHGNSMGYS
ncbi:SDR family NAD(P)-dependent oxidoreductase [Psychrobacillus sp. NPDC093180]|uniref:SDR family NAD(P)-dependent oxidoreductase n=1 Tax=Psychrobacillus sp. NPDC093180 TaxID=3364489 RepID=UPI00382B4180